MMPNSKSKNENIIPGIQIVGIIPIYIAERVLFFFNSSINSKFTLFILNPAVYSCQFHLSHYILWIPVISYGWVFYTICLLTIEDNSRTVSVHAQARVM